MELERPYSNEIIIIKNFTTDYERSLIVDRLNILFGYVENSLTDIDYTSLKSSVSSIMLRVQKDIEDIFINNISSNKNISLTSINNFFNISGTGIEPHYDDVEQSGIETVHYGFVLYHNDDFTGGELVYTNQGISYKPVAGDLVIHPGTVDYTHSVNDVADGVRFTSTMFAVENKNEQF